MTAVFVVYKLSSLVWQQSESLDDKHKYSNVIPWNRVDCQLVMATWYIGKVAKKSKKKVLNQSSPGAVPHFKSAMANSGDHIRPNGITSSMTVYNAGKVSQHSVMIRLYEETRI